jgi:hypothetical protein
MSTLKLDELIVGAGLTLKRTATGVYKFFKTSSTNVVNTPIEMNDSGLILDNPLALAEPSLSDSSLKLAPTSWINKKIGNFSDVKVISAATTLDTSYSGSLINTGGASFTITLPPTASIYKGFTVGFYSSSSGVVTIARNGTQLLFNGIVAGAGSANYALGSGQSIEFTFDGVNWIAMGGTGSASLSTNGYQRLPSGLILQWGALFNTTLSANGSHSISFPISYPTSWLSANAISAFSAGVNGVYSLYLSQITNTGCLLVSDNSTEWSQVGNIYWQSIGY